MQVFYFVGQIFCGFENDYCKWSLNPKDFANSFAWFRNSSMDLEANSIPGPPFDVNERDNGTFVIASDLIARDPTSGSLANLISPYILGADHWRACFSFYVYFGVSAYISIFCTDIWTRKS